MKRECTSREGGLWRWLVVFIVFGPSLVAVEAAPQANAFTRYLGCTYIAQPWNDGDSFHVRMPDGKEQVLRLYFVDTPESENSFPERVVEQAAYFGISPKQSLKLGKQAAAFTKAALVRPFTVHTRWRSALGRGNQPRYYAMITTGSGRDLNELLVTAGMARIYGTRTPLPDGRDSRKYLADLAVLESEAKLLGLGGWRKTTNIHGVSGPRANDRTVVVWQKESRRSSNP